MIPQHLDPTQFTALHSLDLGNVLSLDGRAHPLDAMQPIEAVEVPATVLPSGTSTGPSIPQSSAGSDCSAFIIGSPEWIACKATLSAPSLPSLPKHLGARVVIGLIAVAIIVIVAARLIL